MALIQLVLEGIPIVRGDQRPSRSADDERIRIASRNSDGTFVLVRCKHCQWRQFVKITRWDEGRLLEIEIDD